MARTNDPPPLPRSSSSMRKKILDSVRRTIQSLRKARLDFQTRIMFAESVDMTKSENAGLTGSHAFARLKPLMKSGSSRAICRSRGAIRDRQHRYPTIRPQDRRWRDAAF
jgi:hypothetical protein